MYYKVLRQIGQRLFSCTSYAEIEYRVGQWACRWTGCGPLACFADYLHAKRFLKLYRYDCLYTCEIERSADKHLWSLWKESHYLPEGTVLADQIKLIRRVL